MLNPNIKSEIGKLNGVILHRPGHEIENMIPRNVERALYSDILNLQVALREYKQLEEVLKKYTNVYYLTDLLKDVLDHKDIKYKLLSEICSEEKVVDVCNKLIGIDSETLAKYLIEGVVMEKNTLTKFLDHNRYSLRPLHNFFFMRDSSIAIQNKILISRMAKKVRARESKIMSYIFENHPDFKFKTIKPELNSANYNEMSYEGGDIIIFRENILIIGLSQRTNSQGIDFIIDFLKTKKEKQWIIVQELPETPESFIHLDMAFTCLSENEAMVFKPLIVDAKHYSTYLISIDNGQVVKIEEKENILKTLKELGYEQEAIFCGGENDIYIQEREQWHSGANFFALSPGKILGYKRNVYTSEALNKAGFEVIEAKEIINDSKSLDDYRKAVVVFEGSELARGGGGARCMTMPFNRDDLKS